MSILSTNAKGESLTSASAITAFTSYPVSYSMMVRRSSVTESRCLLMLEDSASASKQLEFMTRNASNHPTDHAWRHDQNGNPTTLYDLAGTMGEWSRITVCKTAADSMTTWVGDNEYVITESENVVNGTNGLDTFFLGGKNPTTNENGMPAYISDFAIWSNTELVQADHDLLKSYWASTIPKTPDYNWRGVSPLSDLGRDCFGGGW